MNRGLEVRNFRLPPGVGVQRNKKAGFPPAVEVCPYECTRMHCFMTLDIPASLRAKEGEITGGGAYFTPSTGHNQDCSLSSSLGFLYGTGCSAMNPTFNGGKSKGALRCRSGEIHPVSQANHEV